MSDIEILRQELIKDIIALPDATDIDERSKVTDNIAKIAAALVVLKQLETRATVR